MAIKCQGNKSPYAESLFTSSSAKALIPANRSFSACFLALNSAKEKLHDHRTSKDWNESQNVISVRYHLLPTHQQSQLFLWYFFFNKYLLLSTRCQCCRQSDYCYQKFLWSVSQKLTFCYLLTFPCFFMSVFSLLFWSFDLFFLGCKWGESVSQMML